MPSNRRREAARGGILAISTLRVTLEANQPRQAMASSFPRRVRMSVPSTTWFSSSSHVVVAALLCVIAARAAAAVCQNLGTCKDGPEGDGTCACPPTTMWRPHDSSTYHLSPLSSPSPRPSLAPGTPVCQNLGTCKDGPEGDGTCACPPTTTGPLCELCAPNYDPDTKCTTSEAQ
ncbi:unnamed protein product [Closterium sp. Naga37s-1]|nr:unnamed protein product [Closterium sp. Naga37s-1]